jgi:Protein of unknown function (DUF4232)
MTITTTPPVPGEESPTTFLEEARHRARRRRLWLGAAALAVAATAIAVTIAVGRGSTEPWTIPAPFAGTPVSTPCVGATLTAHVEGRTVGAGSFGILVSIRNTGLHTCSIGGYPVVTLGGPSLPAPVQHQIFSSPVGYGVGGGQVLPRFNLPVGRQASFWITGSDEPVGGVTTPQAAFGVRILAGKPQSVVGGTLRFRSTGGLQWFGDLNVTPLVPGTSGALPAKRLSFFLGQPTKH